MALDFHERLTQFGRKRTFRIYTGVANDERPRRHKATKPQQNDIDKLLRRSIESATQSGTLWLGSRASCDVESYCRTGRCVQHRRRKGWLGTVPKHTFALGAHLGAPTLPRTRRTSTGQRLTSQVWSRLGHRSARRTATTARHSNRFNLRGLRIQSWCAARGPCRSKRHVPLTQ